MAQVLDQYRKVHKVDDELLRNFFEDVAILECETLFSYLEKLKPRARKQLSEYIVWRLAEVDPGYSHLPEVTGEA